MAITKAFKLAELIRHIEYDSTNDIITATKTKRRKINVRGSANGNPNLAPINAEHQSNTNNAGAALAKLLTSI